jgi:hypothetical protein
MTYRRSLSLSLSRSLSRSRSRPLFSVRSHDRSSGNLGKLNHVIVCSISWYTPRATFWCGCHGVHCVDGVCGAPVPPYTTLHHTTHSHAPPNHTMQHKIAATQQNATHDTKMHLSRSRLLSLPRGLSLSRSRPLSLSRSRDLH